MFKRAASASFLLLLGAAAPQLRGTPTPAPHTPAPIHQRQEQDDAEYRIRPKDVLDIRIEGAHIYSTRFDVDERGHIDLPFVEEVRAAGRTAAELASEIDRLLAKYLKDPKTHVRVVERAN